MNVIGHEDVGENCELKQTGVMKKLLDNFYPPTLDP
jgi:hypothetical protein